MEGEKWLGPDWTAYDFIEVVITIPADDLAALFDGEGLMDRAAYARHDRRLFG
jgi:hypothetical protein